MKKFRINLFTEVDIDDQAYLAYLNTVFQELGKKAVKYKLSVEQVEVAPKQTWEKKRF